jgi:hypothetical protein
MCTSAHIRGSQVISHIDNPIIYTTNNHHHQCYIHNVTCIHTGTCQLPITFSDVRMTLHRASACERQVAKHLLGIFHLLPHKSKTRQDKAPRHDKSNEQDVLLVLVLFVFFILVFCLAHLVLCTCTPTYSL